MHADRCLLGNQMKISTMISKKKKKNCDDSVITDVWKGHGNSLVKKSGNPDVLIGCDCVTSRCGFTFSVNRQIACHGKLAALHLVGTWC